MISKNMTAVLNKQINAETYSAYLYLSMSAACSFMGLRGAATWFYVQMKEEMTHALRFYNYINDMGSQVILESIAGPATSFKSLRHMFEETLKHEKVVTALINNIANVAAKEKDHATSVFVQWFITEQVEEEKNASEILARLKMAGDDKSGLFMIDNELGTRTFVLPADLPSA